ncbi:MAG: SIS domain-containing protein, partial [Clostridia bacterium]|nr:SIS domain-containing protein [Clostridia bacterium]
KAEDVISVVKRANAQGGITLAITNDENSPLAKEAQFHLCCFAEEEKSVAATKTFNAQLFIAIWLAYRLANKPLTDLVNFIKEYPKYFVEADKLTDTYVDKYLNLDNGFILGRGFCYPLALEATLKLQETGYTQIKGYASSVFYHGPMAMVNKDTPIIIYASENDMGDGLSSTRLEDEQKSIDKMLSLGAKVLIVTDNKTIQEQYKTKADVAFMSKSINDAFSVFNFALFAQMLACKASCKKGLNPDNPRALNKVTITK